MTVARKGLDDCVRAAWRWQRAEGKMEVDDLAFMVFVLIVCVRTATHPHPGVLQKEAATY